ncbi:LOW QUALITY PROTEIN: reverse transcriptase [Phytophthora megakarya]|uniref:Reverse transcriptase n=1 Tax=Phytophthora megakarya TaxID=4795 RepID=A0A225W5B9_9STRA|nr:LOW QUALITY PROTEIN: reverse transcriptase [Phytophthora megakarya]
MTTPWDPPDERRDRLQGVRPASVTPEGVGPTAILAEARIPARKASAALQREESEIVTSTGPDHAEQIARNSATKVSQISDTLNRTLPPTVMYESVVRRIRGQRIKQAQDEEKWIVDLKAYLNGDLSDLSNSMKTVFYFPRTLTGDEDSYDVVRLLAPESIQQDFLQYYHTSLKGSHQGGGRTYRKIWTHFH